MSISYKHVIYHAKTVSALVAPASIRSLSYVSVSPEVLDKLDLSIEKRTDITHDVSKILAVHEEKLNAHDKIFTAKVEDTQKQLEKITVEISGLAKRIAHLERYFWIAFGGVTLTYWLVTAVHQLSIVF